MPAFAAMLPDRTIWELVAYIQSIAEKLRGSSAPRLRLRRSLPACEQIPAGRMQTVTPWQLTEPMPGGGAKADTGKE
jgi:hypothetical protein